MIEDLKNALDVIMTYRQRAFDGGVDEMIANLERFKRGGRLVGLSRGFGEILWIGYDWQDEIMAAIDDIEDYYNNM